MVTSTIYPPWNGTFGDPNGPVDDLGWPAYNPNAPVNRTGQIIGIIMLCLFIGGSIALIMTRIILSFRKHDKTLQTADYTVLAAIPILLYYWIGQTILIVYGVGLYLENFPHTDAHMFTFWRWQFSRITFFPIVTLVKVSIAQALVALLPRDTGPGRYNKIRYTLYNMMAIMIMLGISMTLVFLMPYTPVAANFSPTIEATGSLDTEIARSVWSAMSLLLDIGLVVIPVLLLRKAKRFTQMEKRILHAIYAITFLATIMCAAQVFVVVHITQVYDVEATKTQLWLMMVNSAEVFLYVVACVMPTMAPSLLAFLKRRGYSGGSSAPSTMPTWFKKYKTDKDERHKGLRTLDEESFVSKDSSFPTIVETT